MPSAGKMLKVPRPCDVCLKNSGFDESPLHTNAKSSELKVYALKPRAAENGALAAHIMPEATDLNDASDPTPLTSDYGSASSGLAFC